MGNQFDLTLRETFEGIVLKAQDLSAFPFQFNYHVKASFYTANLPKTIEKQMDFAKLVASKDNGSEEVLHLEFQTKSEKNMIVRMQFYLAMIQEWVQVPVKQYVIYLGEQPATMATHMHQRIPGNYVDYHYELIEVRNFEADTLLTSDIPEIIVLAILASRGNVQPVDFVVKVLKRLKKVCQTTQQLNKFVQQLATLSSLRTLDEVILAQKEQITMNSGIRIEDNAIYKGASAERAKKAALNLLKLGKLSDQDIAYSVDITMQELKELKQQLTTNGYH